MKVFKFGGASVKNARAVENLRQIVQKHLDDDLVIIISAMGKTTRALEKLLSAYVHQNLDFAPFLEDIKRHHEEVMQQLFSTASHPIFQEIEKLFNSLQDELIRLKRSGASYDFIYDQIVSQGELLSTKIVSAYLTLKDISNEWVDSRELVKTNDVYRYAAIDWDQTREAIQKKWKERKHSRVIAQGFIGTEQNGHTTTLGKEGSDFSAAIFANVLDAEEMVVWKDVPGILNADPKYFNGAKKLSNISYHEAVELAYYGATIIHPKTIKPLQNKSIPLYIKSFVDPDEAGSVVNKDTIQDALMPSYIFRTDQVLISISPRDYSFIVEENLSHIFGLFAKHGIKVNLMQNSAISFSACIDQDSEKIAAFIKELKNSYKVLYNEGLELLTIRHYDQKTIDYLTEGKSQLVVQKSRHTARMVMKS